MSKTPRLEFLEVRTLLAGAEGPNDDLLAMDLQTTAAEADAEENADEPNEQVQNNLYDLAIFSGLIIGTVIFVAVGIYFGETV